MKALTVRQPWATLIVTGSKIVENRTWNFPGALGERIAIHAGLEDHNLRSWLGASRGALTNPVAVSAFPLGVLLGSVQVFASHRAADPDAIDETPCAWHGCYTDPRIAGTEMCEAFPPGLERPTYHWMLRSAREWVTPIRCKGSLGLWQPQFSEAYLVDAAEQELAVR